MLFEFDNNLWSDDRTVCAAQNRITFTSDPSEKGFASFSGSKILIPEATLKYASDAYTIGIRFRIDPAAPQEMYLAQGVNLPLSILLRKSGAQYCVSVVVITDNRHRWCTSTQKLSANTWYDLRVTLLDNEFLVLINNNIAGRRVYDAEPAIGRNSNSQFHLGDCAANHYGCSAFLGAISSIRLDSSVSAGDQDLSDTLDRTGYLEIESKYMDLQAEGTQTGKCLREKVLLNNDDSAYYNLYENGAIFWSVNNCVWLTTGLVNEYLARFRDTLIGLPAADVHKDASGNLYALFDYAAIVQTASGFILIPTDFYGHYLALDMENSAYGAPLAAVNTLDCGGKKLTYMEFRKAYMVKNEDDAPFLVSKTVFRHYRDSALRQRLGVIVSSDQEKKTNARPNTAAQSIFTMKCDNGTFFLQIRTRRSGREEDSSCFAICGDFNREYEDHMDELGSPTGNEVSASGAVYQNFTGGVIVRYADNSVHTHTTLKYVLSHISAGSIDDGVGDKQAELYIEVTVRRNGTALENERRWPDYDKAKHGGTSFDIVYSRYSENSAHPAGTNVFYSIPKLQGGDDIFLQVKVYDYDEFSGNDFLGSYTFNFNIQNGWGLDKDCGCKKTDCSIFTGQTTYKDVWLTAEGGDNRNGKSNIKLDFSVKEDIPCDLDGYFRKYGYWSFDNYSSSTQVSRATFNAAFSNASPIEKWYDYVLNPIDAIWFEIMQEAFSGESGNCFGLSLEALRALHGRSLYSLPLYDKTFYATPPTKSKYHESLSSDTEIEPGFRELIRQRHLYQGGMQHIHMILRKAIAGELLNPPVAFRAIVKALQTDKYCLVNLFGGGGHTVLAYDYEDDPETGSYKIYVADCNFPWWKDIGLDNLPIDDSKVSHSQKHGSYIRLTRDTVKKVKLYAQDGGWSKTYPYAYATRYHIVEEQPRVPSLIELNATILGTLALIPLFAVANLCEFMAMICTGDADIEEATADGKKLDVVTIPMGDSSIKLIQGFTTTGNINVKFRGLRQGRFSAQLIGRNKISEITSVTAANSLQTLNVTDFNRRRAKFKTASTSSNSIQISSVSKRRGKIIRTAAAAVPARSARESGSTIQRRPAR